MERKSFADMECPVARALDVAGERWTLLIIREAFRAVRRFDDFQDNLGIARNILTSRLKALVSAGILEKRAYAERPRRFEYRLTQMGRDFFPVIVTLMDWGNRWAAPAAGPAVILRRREDASPVDLDLVDRRSGRTLDPRHLVLTPGPGAGPEIARLYRRATGEDLTPSKDPC